MAGINPISGIGQMPGLAPAAPTSANTTAAGQTGGEKVNFGDLLHKVVDRVDQQQHTANIAIQDLVAGRTQDMLPVVSAVAQADLSFKLLIGVRNKVIEAYKQTLNMQI